MQMKSYDEDENKGIERYFYYRNPMWTLRWGDNYNEVSWLSWKHGYLKVLILYQLHVNIEVGDN